MIVTVNTYYIYSPSNNLIMNMNGKNNAYYGGNNDKRIK